MPVLAVVLLVFGFVFFILAGLGLPNPPRFQFIGWGLAFWILVEILKTAGVLGGVR